MHYCPNCKKEFEGNSCPDCGFWVIPLKQETGKPSAFIAVAHLVAVLAIIATGICVYFFVVASPYILLVIFLSNKFSVYNVSKIELGYTQAQVSNILGEPYEATKKDYKWEYFGNNYIKAANEINKCNEEIFKALENDDKNKFERYVEKLSELEEKYKDLTYKYIEVNFSYEEEVYKVSSVYFDANRNAKTLDEKKEVLKVEILNDEDTYYYIDNTISENYVVRYGNNDDKLMYAAKFKDGSYYKDYIYNSKSEISESWLVIKWTDNFSDYETTINSKKIGEISVDGNWEVASFIKGFVLPEKVTSVSFSDNITSIVDEAFYNCSNLTSVIIPASVTSIGRAAFSCCSNLTDINFSGTKEQWNAIEKGSVWDYNTGDYTIHCTDGDISK